MVQIDAVERSTDIIPKIPTVSLERVRLVAASGVAFDLDDGVTRVGSGEGCPVRLDDPSVSRLHCEIRVEVDGVIIVDLHSTNGTYVDGVEVHEAVLAAGSVVRVGATALRVEFGEKRATVLVPERDHFGDVLGSSVAMRRVYTFLERVAPTESTVLIRGETGTGKEMIARAIHAASRRAEHPFVAVDCGAIAESLIESELFGHVRGAFSGATSDRRGLLEEADHGTLFLDEIGELPLGCQPKLLRALETREVRRVGANTSKRLDVRIIAATHRPLGVGINEGSFREDLYYRLAVFELVLPPLRERKEDIVQLATAFNTRMTGEPRLPLSSVDELLARAWPGNVRELKNFVERSACLGWSTEWKGEAAAPPVPALEGLVRVDLPLSAARAVWSDQFEIVYLTTLLKKTGGNVSQAAKSADVNRRTLHRLLAEHKIRGVHAEPDDGD